MTEWGALMYAEGLLADMPPADYDGYVYFAKDDEGGKFYLAAGGVWVPMTSGRMKGGPTGSTGPPGATGPAGPAGSAGATGATGPAGADGAAGATGVTGPAGATGAGGAAGPAGATGPTGPQGTAGTVGVTGATGPQGTAGTVGATGPVGVTGVTGPVGVTGAVGVTGSTGPVGASGAAGATGAAGLTWKGAWSGATAYVPGDVVSSGGSSYVSILAGTNHVPPNITYWNDLADVGATGVTGPAGVAGATGVTGPQGTAGTVGATGVTGSVGPAGATGVTGPAGVAGPTGVTGPVGVTGATGPTGWTMLSKAADQTVANSAVLTDDTALQFAMAANTKYRIRGRIFFDTTATGDYKYTFVGPASPTIVRVEIASAVPGAAPAFSAVQTAYPASTGVAIVGTGTTGGQIDIDMIVHNGANLGTFKFQFAQNTQTNDTGAVTRAGSYLEYAVA